MRNYDIMNLEKRVFAMDGAKIRNYDIFDIEKRIYELETNGGGGSSFKIETGDFVSADTTDGVVHIDFEEIEHADLIIVRLNMDIGTTQAVFVRELNNFADVTGSYWDLRPGENTIYGIPLDSESSETGICKYYGNGFDFRSHGGNTQNVDCDYIAIQYSAE